MSDTKEDAITLIYAHVWTLIEQISGSNEIKVESELELVQCTHYVLAKVMGVLEGIAALHYGMDHQSRLDNLHKGLMDGKSKMLERHLKECNDCEFHNLLDAEVYLN